MRSPSMLLRWGWPRWVGLRDRLNPEPGSYTYDLIENYFHNSETWEDFTRQLERLQELGQRNGFCVHILLHAHLHLYGWSSPIGRIHDWITAAAIERGLTVTDSKPMHDGRDPDALMVRAFDPHPNPLGHALLADALEAGLRTDLPADCWPGS